MVFGEVFTVIAVGLAAVLGIPSAIGLWAMSGANVEGAVPALDPRWRRLVAGFAVATAVVTAVVLLVTGSAATVLNLGPLGSSRSVVRTGRRRILLDASQAGSRVCRRSRSGCGGRRRVLVNAFI